MIKIQLSDRERKEIEDIVINDAKNTKTGVIKILKDNRMASKLKINHPKLYKIIFDCHNNLKEDMLIKILLADKQQMLFLIKMIGKYDIESGRDYSNDLIDNYFRYDNFVARKAANEILKKINMRVCPYCNRQYTITLDRGHVRPQFDHYFPKTYYPYLALSVWNLVPSCSICNMAKSKLDTADKGNAILYPYEDEFGEEIIFKMYKHKDKSFSNFVHGLSQDFDIHICNIKGNLPHEIEVQNEKLHLEDLYNNHKDYVTDIIKKHYITNENRVNELLKRHPLLFKSKEDVISTIYMNDIRKENWGKRPLSKLTRDIYIELMEIKRRGRF